MNGMFEHSCDHIARLLVKNADLSSKIYHRLMQHFPTIKHQLQNVKPFGSDSEGVWIPNGNTRTVLTLYSNRSSCKIFQVQNGIQISAAYRQFVGNQCQ